MEDQVLKTSVDERGMLHSSIHGTVLADRVAQLQKDIEAAKAIVKVAFEKRGTKLRSIIDMSDFSGTFEPNTLMMLGEYVKSNKPYIERSAGFGASATTTLAANVVTALGGRDDIAFFKTREEAEQWLAQ